MIAFVYDINSGKQDEPSLVFKACREKYMLFENVCKYKLCFNATKKVWRCVD